MVYLYIENIVLLLQTCSIKTPALLAASGFFKTKGEDLEFFRNCGTFPGSKPRARAERQIGGPIHGQ